MPADLTPTAKALRTQPCGPRSEGIVAEEKPSTPVLVVEVELAPEERTCCFGAGWVVAVVVVPPPDLLASSFLSSSSPAAIGVTRTVFDSCVAGEPSPSSGAP